LELETGYDIFRTRSHWINSKHV